MKNNRYFKIYIALLFGVVFTITSCAKYGGDYSDIKIKEPFKGSVYEYLKSKPGVFDSMLVVIDRLSLTDTLKNKNITLFAVTNESFRLAINNYNAPRIQLGKTPVTLKDYDPILLDSMICRYIIVNTYNSDSMIYENGITMAAIRYGYPMNGKRVTTDASGFINGGTAPITFSDTKRSLFRGVWIKSLTNSIDVQAANGIIHILEPNHIFGFDEFTKPRSSPFKNTPFQFPTLIGTGVILEAEDFDQGGESAGYHDNDPVNSGGNYRPTEGVDIYAHPAAVVDSVAYTAGYDIGANNAGEWLAYTINVPEDATYKIQVRYGAPVGNVGAYHLEVDNLNVTGKRIAPNTSNWNVWSARLSHNISLKSGKHAIKFFYEAAPIQLESFVITRLF